jgi:hypothetical protein
MFPQERGSRAFEMPTVPKKNTTDQGIGPTGVAKTPLFGLYRPISDVMKKKWLSEPDGKGPLARWPPVEHLPF